MNFSLSQLLMLWAEVGGGRAWRPTTILSHPAAQGEEG